MSTTIRVAVAQIESIVGDLTANFAKHLDVIQAARREHVDLLLFPEMSLTGHTAGARTLELALRREDPRLQNLADASGTMLTTVGLIEEGPATQFYNAAYTLGRGQLIHVHRKVNLATYGQLEDGKHFAGGRYVESFRVSPEWTCATLICNDFWNPALVYLAALHGATAILAPVSSAIEAVGSGFDNPSSWNTALNFYAMVYGLPIMFANRVGAENGLRFWGGSRILNADGKEIARAGDREDLIVAELDYHTVREARYRLPTVRDSNLALISREIQRLEHIVGVPDLVRS